MTRKGIGDDEEPPQNGNGNKQWLLIINTVMTALVAMMGMGYAYLLKEMYTTIKGNAESLIRVEERQAVVLRTLPELDKMDKDLLKRVEALESKPANGSKP